MQCFLFQSAFGLIDMNPYAMKVALVLKMNGIAHQLIYQSGQNQSPTGLLPYIIDKDVVLADSHVIVDYLRQQYGLASDHVLTEQESCEWRQLEQLCEDDLYPIIVYSRVLDPRGLEVMACNKVMAAVFDSKEKVKAVQANMQQLIDASSVSHLTQEQRYLLGIEILRRIENKIKEGALWLDHRPSTVDATIYAFLENIRAIPLRNAMNEYLHGSVIIHEYLAKIQSFL